MAWIKRFSFIAKQRNREKKISGPITTVETEAVLNFWIKKTQDQGRNSPKFDEDRVRLNLQENEEHILECRGRIQGEFPVYLSDENIFSEKLVADAHKKTLHGRVGYTMSKIRETYWIP